MSDQQIQQMVQQRGLGEQLRQRLLQSGLTPDQIRARLRAAGYSENLVDAYLAPERENERAPTPSIEVLRAMSVLGIGDFTVTGGAPVQPDSVLLSRADSFLLDTLGLMMGRDSVPLRRDELGRLRPDTSAVRLRAARLRMPRVFGMDVFRRSTTQFDVAATGPVDPSYRLGPGDVLVLILTGDVEIIHELPVTREGFIVIPQVGQIFVANLSLADLRQVLTQRLGRVYSGVRTGSTRFDVTVTRVRVNQVQVAGDVTRPGAYAVSALGTVLNALYQAGGPAERGSFRAVRVVRGGTQVQTIDLYDYLLTGTSSGAGRVESGDIIFVPPHGPRVTIEGQVLRPAIYEIKPGEGLRELIAMAGGLSADAATNRVLIERILPPEQRQPGGRDRVVLDVSLTTALAAGAEAVPLAANDVVRVFPVTRAIRNRVTVRGSVWHPGSYELAPGMRLSQLLAEAGGLLPDSYVERLHLVRTLPDSTRRLIPVSLRPGDPAQADPELMEDDEITVFGVSNFIPNRQITVFGSVQRPGPLPFRDSMTLRDAVLLAGGLRDEAYLQEAEIARVTDRPGGSQSAIIIRVPLDSTYLVDTSGYIVRPTGRRSLDYVLQPYDNVFIRRLPGWELQRTVVISGEVTFPGRYALWHREERLAELIQRAGGMMPTAYVGGTQFFRLASRAGRVGIDMERVLQDAGYRDNLILLPGDSIHVPEYQPVVIVEGAVNSPVAVAFVPNRSARYYVDRAGGFARAADKGRTYIVQPNGAVFRHSSRVEPGARVVVPAKADDDTGPNWAQILTITSSLVTSLLSIIVISRQL